MALRKDFANILIIKPGAIGDLLQMTPVIRSLKLNYPQAKIAFLVGSRLTADLFLHNPRVDETIIYDRRGEHRSLRSLLRLRQDLKRRKFDLVVNFQRSNLRTWLLATAAFPCTVLVYHKSRNRDVHAVVNYLETLAPLGIALSDTNLELYTGPADRRFADEILGRMKAHGPVIALNPGASHPVNRWPVERFAELADQLVIRLSARVLVVGGPDDVPLVQAICGKASSKPLNLAGKASLLQLAALMEKSDVLVSGDTGPLHLATAAGTHTVALFGAADPGRTGPIGSGHRVIQAPVSCVPCRSRTCSNSTYQECMEKISVQQVMDAVEHMLRS